MKEEQAKTIETEMQAKRLAKDDKVQANTLALGKREQVQDSSLEPIKDSQSFSLAQQEHQLHIIPTNILLKDNADDILEKVQQSLAGEKHPIISETIELAKSITEKYAQNAIFKPQEISYEELPNLVDSVFIALHGRPGEDGAVQQKLEELGLPYNGSQTESSQITIDKYATNELLGANGVLVAKHRLVQQQNWEANSDKVLAEIEQDFGFPIIAKPADDGCSSAVKKINSWRRVSSFCFADVPKPRIVDETRSRLVSIKNQ